MPGNENGWGFVDTKALKPELIFDPWMVWTDTDWAVSENLSFRPAHEPDLADGVGGGGGGAAAAAAPAAPAGGKKLVRRMSIQDYNRLKEDGAEPQIEVEGVGGLSELSEPGNRKGSGTPRGRKGSPGRSASPRGSSPRGSSPRGGKKESSKKGPAAKLKGMSRKK